MQSQTCLQVVLFLVWLHIFRFSLIRKANEEKISQLISFS